MSNNIFSSEVDYVQRFVKNQSKLLKFPTFRYIDAKIHPKHKDHILVLSENKFPKNTKMTFSWDSSFIGGLDNLDVDELTSAAFKEFLEEAEEEMNLDSTLDNATQDVKVSLRGKVIVDKTSPTLVKADGLLEETKELGFGDSSSEEDSYEGGESDKDKSEEKVKV